MPVAPASTEMNLCNIPTHTNAEPKGPGFSIATPLDDDGKNQGYECNETVNLTVAGLAGDHGGGHGVNPGQTIEVHWVHTTCGNAPGHSLAPWITCASPQVRVETQVFVVVKGPNALDFSDFAYDGNRVGGLHQPKALPTGPGEPVQFRGSTTGPDYDSGSEDGDVGSRFTVTWCVRPDGTVNIFKQDHSHGVRQRVINPDPLSRTGGRPGLRPAEPANGSSNPLALRGSDRAGRLRLCPPAC